MSLVTVSNIQLYGFTDKAILIGKPKLLKASIHDKHKAWIPLSFIDSRDIYDIDDIGYIEIPKWVAEQNDLEYDE